MRATASKSGNQLQAPRSRILSLSDRGCYSVIISTDRAARGIAPRPAVVVATRAAFWSRCTTVRNTRSFCAFFIRGRVITHDELEVVHRRTAARTAAPDLSRMRRMPARPKRSMFGRGGRV